jgi:hypothetical protein
VTLDATGVVDSSPAVVPRYTLYEVAPVEAVQLSDAEALPAVAVSVDGAAGTELAPEELELLLDELDDDELEELDDELLELEELEDELELLFFGVAEASLDSTLVPTLFTVATL